MSNSRICFLLSGYVSLEALALLISLSILGIWYIYSEYPGKLIKELNPKEISEFQEMNEIFKRIISNLDLGPKKPKILIYNPKPTKNDIFAFGRQNDFYIAIPSGLAVKIKNEPEIYKTAVLHDLSHIVNRDVTKTYLTLSAWSFFLCYTFFYFLVILFSLLTVEEYPPSVRLVSHLLLGISLLIIIIYFTKNSILRIREFYADQRAASWDKSIMNIKKLLSKGSAIGPSPKSGVLFGLKNLFAVHPSIAQRLEVLTDNKRLFLPNLWVAFTVGMLTAIFRLSIGEPLLLWGAEQYIALLIPSIIVSPLIVMSVGTEVFRSIMWSFSSPRDYLLQRHGLLWLLITAFVMAIGQDVSLLLLRGTDYLLEFDSSMFIHGVSRGLLSFFIPLVYIAYFGKKLMEHHLGKDKPSRIYFGISIFAAILYIMDSILWNHFYIYIVLVFFYFTISAIFIKLIIQNNSKCPLCNARIKESFNIDLKCPACQHDLAEWVKA
jgi:Zn-dependent protease with chaperone function